jgi:large subunit ribosomal protein L32e
MSEHHTAGGPSPKGSAHDAGADQAAAEAKMAKADAKRQAKESEQRAEDIDEKSKEHSGKPAPKADKPASEPAPKADTPADKPADKVKVVKKDIQPKQKPVLDEEMQIALALRNAKSAKRPAFRRQEWFRYKKLGGKSAGWRKPKGMHSKMRMHLKYRPNVASIGYRGPVAARGLHPSGFQEVLVYRPEDLDIVDPKLQAARVGGTVGGRKAELIEKHATKLGIRVLNRRY